MGLRLILTLLAVWLLYVLIVRGIRTRRRNAQRTPPKPVVDMVRCKHCGTHLPAPEALRNSGRYYCCRAHLDADRSGSGKSGDKVT